jgi:drug/metabolite transporter (DMT)-like permease
MMAAMASLIVSDAMMKLAAVELPTGEAIFLRGLVASLLLAGLLLAVDGFAALPELVNGKVAARCFADVLATILYLSALMRMPIADATAVLQFTPLAITAGAALFLGAPVGWRRWLATLVGLIGVLIVVRPGASAFNPYALLALFSIGFIAARDLLTRQLGSHVPALLIALTSAVAVTFASLGFLLFEEWERPSPSAALALAVAAVGLLGGQYWIIVAMRSGDIAVVAPFRYSIVLWAIVAGLLVWREVPDAATWTGIAILVAAGLYTFLREHRLARTARP